MIVLGNLDAAGLARLEAAVARVRALEARMGMGCGQIFMMAAGDAARSARTYQRRKLGLRRVGMDLSEAELIKAMLKSGWYIRPQTGAPTFEGAQEAAERMMRSLIANILTRETQNLKPVERADSVSANNEAAKNEHADAKS